MGTDLFKPFLLLVRTPGFNSRPPCCWNELQGHHRTARENGHLPLVGGIALCDFTGPASPVSSRKRAGFYAQHLALVSITLCRYSFFFGGIFLFLLLFDRRFFFSFFGSTEAPFSLFSSPRLFLLRILFCSRLPTDRRISRNCPDVDIQGVFPNRPLELEHVLREGVLHGFFIT